jgi:hypothetical protein
VEKWDEVVSPQKLLWFESTNTEQKNKKGCPNEHKGDYTVIVDN